MPLRVLPLAVLIAALALAACQPVPPPPGPVQPPVGNCGAARLQGLVGQPARVLATMAFAGPPRILRPGDAVTEDYSLERLNIYIDLDEVIASVSCG